MNHKRDCFNNNGGGFIHITPVALRGFGRIYLEDSMITILKNIDNYYQFITYYSFISSNDNLRFLISIASISADKTILVRRAIILAFFSCKLRSCII